MLPQVVVSGWRLHDGCTWQAVRIVAPGRAREGWTRGGGCWRLDATRARAAGVLTAAAGGSRRMLATLAGLAGAGCWLAGSPRGADKK